MTDTTKRLAEALRELMHQRGVKLYAEGFVQERALTALADFDRTAAQEANVQGGGPYAQFGNDGVLRVDVQRLVDEGIYAKHAAPHPTPAPDVRRWRTEATRARQGEAVVFGYDPGRPEGDMTAYAEMDKDGNVSVRYETPNAADAEAYRVYAVCDRLRDLEGNGPCKHCPRTTQHAVFGECTQLCYAVAEEFVTIATIATIPTAAPVPADEGEKK